jgi:hypothetical protein
MGLLLSCSGLLEHCRELVEKRVGVGGSPPVLFVLKYSGNAG